MAPEAGREPAPSPRFVALVPAGLEGEQMLMLVSKDAAGRSSVQDILPVGFGVMDGQAEVLHS